MSAPGRPPVPTEAWIGPAHLWVVRDGAEVRLLGRPGDLVSLLPLHGPACGVTTVGLRYPLAGEDLAAGSSRGVSNQWVGDARDGTGAGGHAGRGGARAAGAGGLTAGPRGAAAERPP